MKKPELLVLAILSLFTLGCTLQADKPSSCDTEKTGQPVDNATKAKNDSSPTATDKPATGKDASSADETKPKDGDASAEPAGETEPPPAEPDPAGMMDLDVDPTGPALAPPANDPAP